MKDVESLVHNAKVFDKKAGVEKNPKKRIKFYDSAAKTWEKLRADAEKNGYDRKAKTYNQRVQNDVDSANELRDYLHKAANKEYDMRTPDYGGIPLSVVLALGFFVLALGFSSFSITGFASVDDGQLSTVSYIALGCFVIGISFAIIYLKKIKSKKVSKKKPTPKKKATTKKKTSSRNKATTKKKRK